MNTNLIRDKLRGDRNAQEIPNKRPPTPLSAYRLISPKESVFQLRNAENKKYSENPAKRHITKRKLRVVIAQLKKQERKCMRSRRRLAIYKYLIRVYGLYEKLRTNHAERAAKKIVSLFGLRVRDDAHPIRIIIDASSGADLKTKSLWVRALRFAWTDDQRRPDLSDFLDENGGIAGCAHKAAVPTIPELGTIPISSAIIIVGIGMIRPT